VTLRRITGRLRLPPQAPVLAGAQLLVQVCDTTEADAPARVLAQQDQAGLALGPGAVLPFALAAPAAPPGRQHTLQARVQRPDGRGGWQLVLVTTQSHPLPASGDALALELPLAWVG
jgi:uncharacterized lipoprotein YbaY